GGGGDGESVRAHQPARDGPARCDAVPGPCGGGGEGGGRARDDTGLFGEKPAPAAGARDGPGAGARGGRPHSRGAGPERGAAPGARPAACMTTGNPPVLAAMNADGSLSGLAKSDPASLTAQDRREGRIAPGLTPQVSDQGAAAVAPAEFDLGDTLDNLTDEIS